MAEPSAQLDPSEPERAAGPDWRRPMFVAFCVVAVAVVAVVVVGVLAHRGHRPIEQAAPPTAQPRPSLAGAPPEKLRRALVIDKGLASGWTVADQTGRADRGDDGLGSTTADPKACLPQLLGQHGKAVGLVSSAAPDFTRSLYDGRYATEIIALPQPGGAGPLEFARSWLARCGSFKVQMPGQQDLFSAFAVRIPVDIPGADESLGVKLLFAYSRTDPFQNKVYYFALARVRGVDVLVVSGLPGLPSDLAERSVANLNSL